MPRRLILRGAAARAYLAAQASPDEALRDFASTAREAYTDVVPAGSWEEESSTILDAARQDPRFGGPARDYNDPLRTDDTPSDYHFSMLAAFPHEHKVTISNSKSGELYHAQYDLAEDGTCTFSSVTPAQLEVTAKAKTALEAARAAGLRDPQHVPFQIISPVRAVEAITSGANAGGFRCIALTVGPGNAAANNWYTESFIDDAVELLAGNRSWYDHPTATEERDLPERSVLKLCGWFSDVKKIQWTDPLNPAAGAVPAVEAIFHPRVGDPVIASLIGTCQEHAAAYPEKVPFVAFSINGMGVGAPGDAPDGSGQKNLMQHMTLMESTDLVTRAGARGRFAFEESDTMHTRRRGQSSRESGFMRFAGGDVVVELNPKARQQREQEAREAIRRANVTSALAGPLGPTIREAAKIDKKKAAASLTDDEVTAVLAQLGSGERSAFEAEISRALTGVATVEDDGGEGEGEGDVDEGDEEEGDEEEGDEDGDNAPTEAETNEALREAGITKDDLAKMSPKMRAKVKKIGAKMARPSSGATTRRTKAAKGKESARITTLEAQIDKIGRDNVVKAAMTVNKLHESHAPLIEPFLVGATTPAEIGARVALYAEKFVGVDSVGVPAGGRSRESGSVAPSGGYTPSFRKQ